AVPRHAGRDDGRARHPLPPARQPRRACPPRHREAALRRLRHLDPGARPRRRRARRRDRRRLARGRGRRGRPGGARALCQLVEGRALNYRFEQLTPSCWAAVALDTGAAVGNAGIAGTLAVDCGFVPSAGRELRAHPAGAERLFITHADFDHYGGAQAFADLPILATEQTAKTIREVGPGRVAGMKEQMETYLAELDDESEREQARLIAAEIPTLELAAP